MSKASDRKGGGFWWEDGKPAGQSRGRAGRAPGSKHQEGPMSGGGLGLFRRGPTRGTSRTGHDRRGGWFFGGGKGKR
jgi:hypothetical protein